VAEACLPPLRAQGLVLRPLGAPHDVLQDLDVLLEPGQRLALVGPSGSGRARCWKRWRLVAAACRQAAAAARRAGGL
jgi:ABC-type protease/lipase transport system fused ATPase/permease subunit